ncbi:MAG: hypothetical protein ACK4EX_11035 [Thermaurantimonas sp.]|uniref:hypothetical protein n=1 Tax=Thermaurantimonas sp. TaxID=2681568 RepID=UPI00391D725B
MGVPPDKAPQAPSSGVGLSAHIRLAAGRGTSGCGGFACRLLALCASGPSAAAHIRFYPSRTTPPYTYSHCYPIRLYDHLSGFRKPSHSILS